MAPPPDSPPPSTWLDESEYQDQTRTINEQLDVENICLLSLEGTAEDTPQRRAEIQVTIRSLKKQLKQLRLARQKQESAQQQAPPPANTNKKLDMFGYRFGSDGIDPSKLIAHNANNLGRPPRGEKRSYSDHRGDSLSGFPTQSDWKSRKTTPDTRPGNRAGWHDGGADDGDSSSVIDLTREDDDGDVSDWKEQQREAAETYRRNKEQEEEDARYARLLQDSAYEGLDFSAATTSLPPPAQSGSSSFGQIPSQNYSKTPMPYGSNYNLPLRSPQSAYVPGPSHTVLHDSASASKPSRMPGAWDSGDDDDDIIGPLSSPGQMSNAFGPGFGAASSSGYGAGDFARQAAARRQRQLQYANNGGRISSAPSLVPGASSSSAANGQLGSRPGSLFNGSANPWANRAGMYRPNGMSLPGRDSLSQIINRTNNYNWDEGLDEFGLPLPDHVVSYIDDYVSDPRKTDQQIKELLANISPDMDVTEEDREGTPEGFKYPLYKHQQIALKWMRAREDDEKTKGGLLADDMGLGKTISMLALLLSRPAHKNSDSKKSKADVVKTNVIVGPVALIRQWEREIEKKIKSGHRLSVHNYHRKKATYRDLRKFDVVLNSYGKLGAELKELEKYTQDCGNNGTVPSQEHLMKICPFVGPKSMFYRVVLDEAQCIKNKNTQMAKACYRIQAQHRWCLSGTPMMNSVDELASLVHFLRIKPFDDFKEFAKTFNILSGKRSSFGNVRGRAMERLQILLKSFMLRRTKSSKIDGKPIIELKPKVEMTDHVVFNEDEAQYYQDLEKTSQVTFSKFLQAGTVGKKYNQVLVLLLRLRQACCHPYLHITDLDYGSHEISEDDMVDLAKQLDAAVVKRIKEQEPPFECPICYDTTINPSIMLPCGHYTCGECLVRLSGQSAQQNLQAGQEGTGTQCPECRTLVNLKKVVVYDVFQQVHMPEAVEPAAGASTAGGADADETDSDETDSETDSDDSATASEGEEDDDVDEYGDLQDFIVHDDDDGVSSSGTKDEEDDGSDFTPSDSTKEAGGIKSSKRKSRSAKAKSKLKSKGKGKQPRKQADHKGKKKASAVTPETLGKLRKEASNNAQAHREYMKYLRKIWLSSAKVAKCKELIENIQKTGEKTIVFSQWTLLLDLLEIPVKHELKLSFRRYDGGMSASNRDAAVRDFMENENVKVILVSLKAGNSGLNLTAASQVIIMDPFWNPYTEMQAVDRAHRIGQQNPVQVHRVLVKGTVEDRIMELQDKKRELVDTALDEGVAKQLGRLNSNDLAYLFGIGSH